MRQPPVLPWIVFSIETLVCAILIIVFANYQINGLQEFMCGLGDATSCNNLQTAAAAHAINGFLIVVCLMASLGFFVWSVVETVKYNRWAERQRQWESYCQLQQMRQQKGK